MPYALLSALSRGSSVLEVLFVIRGGHLLPRTVLAAALHCLRPTRPARHMMRGKSPRTRVHAERQSAENRKEDWTGTEASLPSVAAGVCSKFPFVVFVARPLSPLPSLSVAFQLSRNRLSAVASCTLSWDERP